MADKLTLLEQPINEQIAAVEQLKRNLSVHLEFLAINAKITRTKFTTLVAEGFTEEQALELCK